MKRFAIAAFLLVSLAITLADCNSSKNGSSGGINLFSIDQDKQLGAQVETEIASDPAQYPLLDSASNKEVYAYMYKIRNAILNSGKLVHKDDFPWKVRVIRDDKTLNAFCTPGGYIYIYTGILKYMDNEAQLAGVLGHEMGHADLRHSTRQMTELYGVEILLQVLAGDRATLKQVAESLVSLKFSRNHETEADEASVRFLCPTSYPADAGAGFFEKMRQAGTSSNPPQFLSDHPDPDNRIEHFHEAKARLGCTGNQTYDAEYKRIIAKLP